MSVIRNETLPAVRRDEGVVYGRIVPDADTASLSVAVPFRPARFYFFTAPVAAAGYGMHIIYDGTGTGSYAGAVCGFKTSSVTINVSLNETQTEDLFTYENGNLTVTFRHPDVSADLWFRAGARVHYLILAE